MDISGISEEAIGREEVVGCGKIRDLEWIPEEGKLETISVNRVTMLSGSDENT